jgi:hypothetical protein
MSAQRSVNRAYENMLSVRRLQKTAYYRGDPLLPLTSVEVYGQEWEIWPTNFFVFAFDSVQLSTLGDALIEKHERDARPAHQRIDAVCVLDKGLLLNRDLAEGRLDALPTPGSLIRLVPSERALLLFYTMISQYLNQARLPHFRFGA